MEYSFTGLLIFLAALAGVNAIAACAEHAAVSVSKTRLRQLTEAGDKRAARFAKMTEHTAGFLTMLQMIQVFAGCLCSAFAAVLFSGRRGWTPVFLNGKVNSGVVQSGMIVLIALAVSYIFLIFGKLLSKKMSAGRTEKLALSMSGLLWMVWKLSAPAVWFLTLSVNGILRLLGVDPETPEEHVSEEGIRMMADAGSKKGIIDREENEIIQNLFEFDDLTVGEFSTHRTDIALLWMDETLEQWEKTIHESRHTMYPVCDETVDNVLGVLNVKDYFRLRGKTKQYIIKHAVKPAQFIPESVRADVMFRRMKSSRNHFAVVLDEYGGMTGIVTMNDLLEQLVGDLEDDLDGMEEEPKIEQLDSATWRIDGGVDLEDAAEKLDVKLPLDEYDTFGGFVFGMYGSIPSDGTRFELDTHDLHIKVTAIKEHRLERAIVCKMETDDTKKQEEPDK